MNETVLRIVACLATTCMFCLSTIKLVGALQQGGYKGGCFTCWLRRKDNLQFNRLSVFALCLALTSAITSLSFSFMGVRGAQLVSAIPFFIVCLAFYWADGKYSLKVPVKRTGRFYRLFTAYFFVTACVSYLFIALLGFLAKWNGSTIYGLVAYVPYAVMPALLPLLLCFANAVEGSFENVRNNKFVKRAGKTLEESKMIRVGIVGSYGKTGVKNVLATLLSEKYAVIATPESYNTPMGIAKTVCAEEFAGKEIFIAEMGARKAGDISALCNLVKPDYVIFTGICNQHIHTFGDIDGVWSEKKQALLNGAKVAVCGDSLKERIASESFENVSISYAETQETGAVFGSDKTSFSLRLGEKTVAVETSLLGKAAVENITLAAKLAFALGLTAEEIEKGLKKLQPTPHRLQLLQNNGVYILDDSYNCNPVGATEALAALGRFSGRKCIVTPGIVECGILEEEINGTLGQQIANANLDKVVLVGETLVGCVKNGYKAAGGNEDALVCVKTLAQAQTLLSEWVQAGDAVLFLNDLPDVY